MENTKRLLLRRFCLPLLPPWAPGETSRCCSPVVPLLPSRVAPFHYIFYFHILEGCHFGIEKLYLSSCLVKTKRILNAFLKRDGMCLQEVLLSGGLRACIKNYVFLNSIDVFIGNI